MVVILGAIFFSIRLKDLDKAIALVHLVGLFSSTIFAILKDEGFGVQFCSALSKDAFELCGFAYVDDADLLQTGHCAKEVSKNLQAALTTWEEVINATGGAMAPSKT